MVPSFIVALKSQKILAYTIDQGHLSTLNIYTASTVIINDSMKHSSIYNEKRMKKGMPAAR